MAKLTAKVLKAPKPVPRPIYLGNIDLTTRPQVKNPDGSISTVRSMSYGLDNGLEVLIPTVTDDGRILPWQEAAQYWAGKGQNLGIFNSPFAADEYARHLHDAQARMIEDPNLGGMIRRRK